MGESDGPKVDIPDELVAEFASNEEDAGADASDATTASPAGPVADGEC